MKSILDSLIPEGPDMSMLTLMARLRAVGSDTPDTPAPPPEVSSVALPLLVCPPDTSDTPPKNCSLALGIDSRAVPNADTAAFGSRFSAPVPGEVDPEAFDARVALFRSHHVPSKEAGDLANQLGRRDVQTDDRRLCLECCHLSGSAAARRCANWRITGMRGPSIPSELVDLLQRCAGFAEQAGPVPTSLAVPTAALVVGQSLREDECDA
jgi:hypothetical protein